MPTSDTPVCEGCDRISYIDFAKFGLQMGKGFVPDKSSRTKKRTNVRIHLYCTSNRNSPNEVIAKGREVRGNAKRALQSYKDAPLSSTK